MNFPWTSAAILLVAVAQLSSVSTAQEPATTGQPTMEEVKSAGALRSSYLKPILQAKTFETPHADLETFREQIEPMLKQACYDCHGPDTAEGDLRIDELNPDLQHGEDVDWWLEVSAAVTNGEMPPEDGPELNDADRSKIIQWLCLRNSGCLAGTSVRAWSLFVSAND